MNRWILALIIGGAVFSSSAYSALLCDDEGLNCSPAAPIATAKENQVLGFNKQLQLVPINSNGVIGEIKMFATVASVPKNCLIADGRIVSSLEYPQLVQQLSGSDLTHEVSLPDLRGEFVRGVDLGRGIDLGREPLSFQASMIEAHEHSISYGGAHGRRAKNRSQDPRWSWGDISHGNSPANAKTQLAGGHETRPRNVALVYCIIAD